MLNLLQKKTITVLSSLAVSFGAVLVPANMVQAAVFELRIDGLGGSGEIGFDDESLIGAYEEDVFGTGPVKILKGSELINGYFNWSFTAEGEGSTEYVFEDYIETYPITVQLDHTQFIGVGASFGSSHETAFRDADFMFQNGELLYIYGYSASLEWSGSSYFRYSFSLNEDSANLFSNSTSFDGEKAQRTDVFKNNLKPTYSTIVPWQNPNSSTEVPEPNTISASLIGVAFLLKKKNRSQPKNSQKSEKI